MKKEYIYTVPAIDEAYIGMIQDDLAKRISEAALKDMGLCILETFIKCRLGQVKDTPGETLAFCEKTLEEYTYYKAENLVFKAEKESIK